MLRVNKHTSGNPGVYEQTIKIEELKVYTLSRGFCRNIHLVNYIIKLLIHNNQAFRYASHM